MILPNFLPIFLDSKSISNLLALLLEVTYLLWGSLNKDNLKSSYDRWVTKPSSHTSNFLRCSLYSCQFFFFFFIDGEFASVKCRQNLCSAVVGFSPSWTRLQLRTKYGLYSMVSFSCLLSFPFLSALTSFFLLSGTRNSSILRSESSSVCDFLCKLVPKDYGRYNSSFASKMIKKKKSQS